MASHNDTVRDTRGGAHDARYRSTSIRWGSAVWAGIAGGIVFVLMQMLMVWMFMGQSPWGPPRMISAIVMGQGVLPPPASFDLGIIMVAMMIHLVFSVIYGLVIGALVHRLSKGAAILTGAVFGLVAMYFVNFHLIAPTMFPWFTQAQNWVTVLSHLLFGIVTAAVYVGARDRHA